jgi:tetratricopeptide (TPR) repeat protein
MSRTGDSSDSARRHRRLKEIVLAADRLSGDERERFLAEACSGDDELARAAHGVLGGGAVATDDVAPKGFAHAADDDVAPTRLGPFRIVREIGRGGMGVVYEATDERDGGRVAVKAIHARLLGNARAEERFAREAAAGAQVDHPNVVRTIGALRVEDDAGRARGVLVTELVEGRTLRDLSRALGRVPESLLREIARGMAHGLAAVHAAGIVHRDLKPENVMLTTDARVRVMDLGVARLLDADEGLTREGDFVGSLEYAAPEQCEGREAGPAADLYAVGVVLYELACGANPFARAGAIATVSAHLTHAPPAPAGLSPFLADVVSTLIERDPARRFASAAELARVLGDGEGGAWWRERARVGAAATAPDVPVARDLVLQGRGRELAALRSAFETARTDGPAVVLLTGEPGLGKTRILDAFLRSLDAEGARRLYGAVPATGGGGGLFDAVLEALGGDRAEAWLVDRAGMSPPFAASVAAFLRREPPPVGSPALDGDAVESALRRVVLALAQEKPTILALDDVHNAGPETAAQIESLVRGVAGARVLVVLAARPDRDARWTEALARRPGFRSVALSRLGADDVVAILRNALGSEDLALRAARRIAAKSGGVPLYVAAMLGALRDALAAAPLESRARAVEQVDVPMELRDAVAARLVGLSAEERTCLDACAVQGAAFDVDVAADATSTPIIRFLQVLAEVERRLGLVRADGRRFRFDHQLVADAVLESVPPRLREEYHLRTARTVENRAAAARTARPSETIARHLLESGEPALAVPDLARAIDALEARHEGDAALALASRALAVDGLLAAGPRVEALLRVAGLHRLAGRRSEETRAAEEALAVARATRDLRLVARAFSAVGRRMTNADESRHALPRLRAAIRIARRVGDVPLEVKAAEGLGSALITLGRVDEARECLESARGLAVAAHDAYAEHLTRRGLGMLALGVARHEDARVEFERCLELAKKLGSPRAEAHAEWGLGAADLQTGEWEAANARFVRSRDVARAVGDRTLEINSIGDLAVCAQATGEWMDAAATLRELRPVVVEAGNRALLSLLLVHLSQVSAGLGDVDAARAAMDEAAAVAHAVGFRSTLAQVALRRGESELDAGDLVAAGVRLREAHDEMVAAGDAGGRVDVLLLLAGIELDSGYVVQALRALDDVAGADGAIVRPSTRLLVAALRARLPGGDAAAARAIADEVGPRATVTARMRARFDLHLADGGLSDLAEARRLLADALQRLPAERRRASIAHVRLHREIAAACARAGLPPPV